MNIILLIPFIYSAINIKFNNREDYLEIEEEIYPDHICQGYFRPFDSLNCDFELTIRDKETGNIHFYRDNLSTTDDTHFSFNCVDDQTVVVRVNVKKKENGFAGKLKYFFDMQYNTFDKEVAKGVRYEPAIQALIGLQKILHESWDHTRTRAEKLHELSKYHGNVVKVVLIFNAIALIAMMVVNFYQTYSMKRFFKRKKLI